MVSNPKERLRARAVALAWIALVAAAAFGEWRWHTNYDLPVPIALWRNLISIAAVLLLLVSARAARARDLPFPRARWAAPACAAAAALVAALPTIRLPYLGDDYALLETRGGAPTVMQTLFGRENELWFRPTGWILWRLYHWASPFDAALAHGVSIALFCAFAAVLPAALRRCGAPRGVASAAAVLYAFSPAALETVAWVTNQYSLLSALFGAAAIALLPARGAIGGSLRGARRARRMAIVCMLAFLAFLSKEDSFLLPFLALAAAARFRIRRLGDGLRAAWPLFVVLAAAVACRTLFLGGVGGYSNQATGRSTFVERAIEGPRAAVEMELPSAYWILSRDAYESREAASILAFLPVAILAIGAARAAGRRCVPISILWFALWLAPVSSVLPVGVDLSGARWLYAPSAGIALLFAAALAGWPLLGRARWVPILAFGVLWNWTGQRNYSAWRDSGGAARRGISMIAHNTMGFPEHGGILIAGLSESIRGALLFNCDITHVVRFAMRRDDVYAWPIFLPADRIAAAVWADPRKGDWIDFLDARGDVIADTKNPYSLHFAGTPPQIKSFNLVNTADPSEGARYFAGGSPGMLLLPSFDASEARSLTLRIDPEPEGAKPLVFLTYAAGDALRRDAIQIGAPYRLPEARNPVRIDITIPAGTLVAIRSIRIDFAR